MLDWLINPISYIFFIPFWVVFVMLPFLIVKYVIMGIELIAVSLPKLLLFGSTQDITLDNLPILFFRLIVISVGLWFLFFIVVLIRFYFLSSEEGVKSVKTALQYSFLCWIYIALVPMGVFALYLFLDWIMTLIGIDSTGSVGDMLFMIIKPDSISAEKWQAVADNYFLISLNDFAEMGGWTALNNILFTTLMGLVISIGVLLAYLFASITILQKIFDQVFLFILSPVIATTSVIDGGKRMVQWRDMMISKSLVVFGIVLGSRIYVSLLIFVSNNISNITGIPNSNFFFINLPNIITIILIALGGAFAFSEFGHLLSGFIGEGSSLKESAAQTKSMIKSVAGIATGGVGAAKLAKGAISKATKGNVLKLQKTAKSAGLNIGNFDDMQSDVSEPNYSKKELNLMRFKNTFSPNRRTLNTQLKQQIQHRKMFDKHEKLIKKEADLKNKKLEIIIKNNKIQLIDKQKKIDKINKKYSESIEKINKDYKSKVDDLLSNSQKNKKDKK